MRKTPFGASFRYWELEVSTHFTTGIPKCWNVKMRKTPFGVGFGYRELEVSKHFPTRMPKCRNAKNTFWCKFQILGVGSVETLHHRNAEM
jgi:hypothetical protein